MDIRDYISRVERNFSNNPLVISFDFTEAIILETPNNRSQLKVRVSFFDSSYLDFCEIVESSKCFPQWINYEYQYVCAEGEVFRYDNKPHHRGVSTFPNHKHVAIDGRIIASEKPSINNLLDEIRLILANPNPSNSIFNL